MSTVTNGKVREGRAGAKAKHASINKASRQFYVSPYLRRKARFEQALAAVLLVPGIAVIALLVLIVRCTSRGRGIYRQRRVGKDGMPFTMYKIRTMRSDAEAQGGARWCRGDSDPRVTRIGRWIRKCHLDEFPQLWNVLLGEMSLIGPRPERPEFVGVLQDVVTDYDERHGALPGITGLAQLNLPPDTDVASVRRKLVLDLEYLQRASFLLDLRIFMCTLLRLLGFSGESAMTIMRLHWSIDLLPDDSSSAGAASAQLTPLALAASPTIIAAAKSSGNGDAFRHANATEMAATTKKNA